VPYDLIPLLLMLQNPNGQKNTIRLPLASTSSEYWIGIEKPQAILRNNFKLILNHIDCATRFARTNLIISKSLGITGLASPII